MAQLEIEGSTLDEIVAALVAGDELLFPRGEGNFALDGPDARKALRFYDARRDLWAPQKAIQGKEIDELLAAIEAPLRDEARQAGLRKMGDRPLWKLARIEAHRFAGLHRHCDDKGGPPGTFSLEIDREVTGIWGFNGAGKTALQSAITWCLTGKALRSQHRPNEVHEPMQARLAPVKVAAADDDALASDPQEIAIPPIVPLPSAGNLAVLKDKPALDTWVELTLKDQSGREAKVKRALVQPARGALKIQVQGLEPLGLPDYAIEAGTLMPAIAASMRFDEKTSFAAAISQLTGLRPLEDFGLRASRVAMRLGGDELEKAGAAMMQASQRFADVKRAMSLSWEGVADVLGDFPDLLDASQVEEGKNCERQIAGVGKTLREANAIGQRNIVTLLGAAPDLGPKALVADFLRQLDEAKDDLGKATIATLPSIAAAKRIGAITQEDRDSTRATLHDLHERSLPVVARLKDAAQAARRQLYSLVGHWHAQHHPDEPFASCPVCATDLAQVPPDALLQMEISRALEDSVNASADASKGLQDWQRDAARELLESLPESVRPFADVAPAASLSTLYKSAFVDELLGKSAFSGQLASLKRNAASLWALACAASPWPPLERDEPMTLPKDFAGSLLDKRFANVQAAMRLAAKRQASDGQLRAITARYLGPASVESPRNEDMRLAPLRDQVSALRQAIVASEPILGLIKQLEDLESARKSWREADRRSRLISRAAAAVRQFSSLPGMVQRQVQGLIALLESRTQFWLERLYRAHYVGGPAYCGLDPTQAMGVGLVAGMDGLSVQAHQVMNSSQLRACVWAFVFSLWERIRDRTGALDFVLLDDPQTHFDPINAENLAAAIPAMALSGMSLILTSNDLRFLSAVRDKLPKSASHRPTWAMLQINPISRSRLTASIGPAIEEILERRDAWRDDENDVAKAQDYVVRVRLHIENRLWDLLAGDPSLIYKPTLADLVNHLRSARNAGEKPFNEEPFERLLAARDLVPGSLFYNIVNHAHHDLKSVTPQDAATVDESFDEVARLLRSCGAAYARFMGRLTREEDDLFYATPPPPPTAVDIQRKSAIILGDFSARTDADALAIELPQALYSFGDLKEVALFGIRGASLGTLALSGQVVIVSLEESARNGDPVIALYGNRVLARRLHLDPTDPSRVTLTGDLSGSEQVAPAMMLQRAKVRLLPIVGVLYDSLALRGKEEAVPVDSCGILDRRLLLARIVDHSGYPVVRAGDSMLVESMAIPSGAVFDKMKGDIVAFVAGRRGEHYAYLKRVGNPIGSAGLRLFENVGTSGDALAVQCPIEGDAEPDASSELVLQRMWRVHGVLRARS
jgi:hypothetical protein